MTPCSDQPSSPTRRSSPAGSAAATTQPTGSAPPAPTPAEAPPSADYLAWLDAIEAECETISGHTREALRLIGHAETILAAGSQHTSPDWFTWFTPHPAGHVQGDARLEPGHLPQARDTLSAVLADPSIQGGNAERHGHPRRPGRRRSGPAPPRSRLRIAPSRPSTSSAGPGTQPAWTASSTSARPSSPTPNWTASRPSMTGSMTGRPRSARSSVERGDLPRQLGQPVNPGGVGI